MDTNNKMKKQYQTKLKNFATEGFETSTASEFIEGIDLNELTKGIILPPKYHQCKVPSMDFLKILLYKNLKGHRGYRTTHRHLQNNPSERKKLKIDNMPVYESLMMFKNQRMGNEILEEIICRMKDIQAGRKILIRDNVESYAEFKVNNPLKLLSTKQKKKLIKSMHSFISHLKDNSKLPANNLSYTDKDIMDAIVFMVSNGQSANAFSEANRFYYEAYERGDAPCSRTILNWIKEAFPTREKVEEFNQYVLAKIFNYIKQNMPNLTKHNHVNIAIDHHMIPVWEDVIKSQLKQLGEYQTKRQLTNPTHIISNAKDRFKSTINFRKYISCSIVIKGMRFCMGYKAIDQINNSFQAKLVSELIDYVKQFIGIKVLLLDRNFDHVEMHSMLQFRGVFYIMPKVIRGEELKNCRVKTQKFPKCHDVLLTKYTEKRRLRRDVIINVAFIKMKNRNYKKRNYNNRDKNKKYVAYAFCTNMPIKSKKAALQIAQIYRQRWGVEVFYKDSKNFFAKTTSNDSVIRDFYFSQSINVFNLWVLCNLVLFVVYLRKDPDKPKIRMKTFVTSLKGIEYRKHPPPPSND